MSRSRGSTPENDAAAMERAVRNTTEPGSHDRAHDAAARITGSRFHGQCGVGLQAAVFSARVSAMKSVLARRRISMPGSGPIATPWSTCRRACILKARGMPSFADGFWLPAIASGATCRAISIWPRFWGSLVLPLELINSRFYHLDTCFSSRCCWPEVTIKGVFPW